MEIQSKCQRIKTWEHVTVHGLESALEKGLQIVACLHYHIVSCPFFQIYWYRWQVGHRDLVLLTNSCSGMDWKTAASSHISAFLTLFPILLELLYLCSNGKIPDSMLQKARCSCPNYMSFWFPVVHFWFPCLAGTLGLSHENAFHVWERSSGYKS